MKNIALFLALFFETTLFSINPNLYTFAQAVYQGHYNDYLRAPEEILPAGWYLKSHVFIDDTNTHRPKNNAKRILDPKVISLLNAHAEKHERAQSLIALHNKKLQEELNQQKQLAAMYPPTLMRSNSGKKK